MTLYFNMAEVGVDDLAERTRSRHAKIVADAVDQPWNTREATIADPDGYHLAFTQVRNVSQEFD